MVRFIPATVSALLVLLFSAFSISSTSGQSLPVKPCSDLADLRVEDTNLLSATVVPASDGLPEYCRVLGYVRPAVNFEIRLPTADWNGKFYMAGCWGFCGTLVAAPDFILGINSGLQRGYAASTMDTGHWGEDLFDARWAYHNRQAEVDFGYRAMHETARVTKTLIEAFYGVKPERSYFGGCSGGGRQAVMEALRYPEDFDGIISGCPWLDAVGQSTFNVWVAEANTAPDGRNLITPSELPLVREAVYSVCDALDGLEDGLISNPRACRFDPATLACEGDETGNCLSEDQVEALSKIYSGPRDSAGRQLYPGVSLGSTPDWIPWVSGETADANDDLHRRVGTQYMRYMAFREDPGEAYTIEEFDFDRDPPRLEFMAEIFSVENTDLDAFRERGGKLLMWHGWADANASNQNPEDAGADPSEGGRMSSTGYEIRFNDGQSRF